MHCIIIFFKKSLSNRFEKRPRNFEYGILNFVISNTIIFQLRFASFNFPISMWSVLVSPFEKPSLVRKWHLLKFVLQSLCSNTWNFQHISVKFAPIDSLGVIHENHCCCCYSWHELDGSFSFIQKSRYGVARRQAGCAWACLALCIEMGFTQTFLWTHHSN